MRTLGLNLFVALALFGFAAAGNSDRQTVALAYREHIDIMATFYPEWRALYDAQIVNIEVDGDEADASLRVDGCTMRILDTHFHRGDDGWEPYALERHFDYRMPPCEEGGEIPPPELAWTWQDRNWR